MQFFGNKDNDLLYLKVRSKLNLAYWTAFDLNHYVTNYSNSINQYEFSNLIDQYYICINIYNEAEDLIEYLPDDHKRSLLILRNYVKNCLSHFRIDNFFTDNKNSEQEEIEMLEMLDHEKVFFDNHKEYLIQETFEYDLLQAHKYFSKGVIQLFNFINSLLFTQDDKKLDQLEKIIDSFMSSRILIESSLKNKDCHNNLLSDFVLMHADRFNLFKKDDFKNYLLSNIQFIRFWHENFLLHERFCKLMFEEKSFLNLTELELFDNESTKYTSCITKAGIEITLKELEFMGEDTPHIEIYSAKRITSPIESLLHKNRTRLTK